MKRLVNLVIAAALLIAAPVQAVKKYSCDFETEAARNRWVLNPAKGSTLSNLRNFWYIGAPGNNGKNGQYGLYISNDNGQHAQYTNAECWVVAYDTVRLDYMATGDYTLSFDYCAMANVASNADGLYVLWVPMLDPEENIEGGHDSIPVVSVSNFNGIPSIYNNYVLQLQPTAQMDYLNGTSTWRQCAVTIKGKKCDGEPHYLVFVWANGSNQAQQPAAMVDNIEIADDRPCDPVTNMTVVPDSTSVIVSWTGNASEYEVSAYSYETNTWAGPKTVTTTTATFNNLPIGQTDFIVRAKCDEEYSLKTIVSKLIYYPDMMCVNYLDLNNAKCYIDNSSPSNTLTFSDFKQVPAQDFGPSNIKSRHVVHFDRAEMEPRTGGLAHTVPDGELASIRLGNWEADNHAERIEFTFPVDTIQYPVLLLKYLPILEAPGHDDHENPRFKLDMLVNGVSIGRCGMADFNCNDVYSGNTLKPGAAAQGWHITKNSVAQTSADVVWKEWTTVGVNLRKGDYHGKNLTVRLTTHDCTFSAHCGYAYFTLGCSDGKLKGMKCGEINETFEAPDGFAYRWAYAYNERYRAADGSLPEQYVLGRSQQYHAGLHDDSLYVVDCMFVQDSTCYFSLYASTLATNPISLMNDPLIVKNCTNDKYIITFDASPSYVQEIDHVKEDTLVSESYHIEHYEWTVEGMPDMESDEIKPTFTFPRSGGDYVVKLRTTCGTCESILSYDLHLDPLGPTHDTVTVVLCDDARQQGYIWDEKQKLSQDTAYFEYGVADSVVLTSELTSCDSIIYLKLIEPVRIYEDTMIMTDSLPYLYHGRSYMETTLDTVPVSDTNCDTTWILNLEVYEPLKVEMPVTEVVLCEGDDTIHFTYDILRGRSLRWYYTFNTAGIPDSLFVGMQKKNTGYPLVIPVAPDLYPNVYNGSIVFVDSLPEKNVTIPLKLTMQYASTVIAQRWNDVLAIRNADYNGGYLFDSVQWYLNGAPIEGATEFNYYTEGTTLRFGEEYTALLTRNDGVQLFTCPLIPERVPVGVHDMPTLVMINAPLEVPGTGTAYWYDLLGRRHSTQTYDNSAITTPSVAGYYLLVLQSEESSTHRMVVR